MSAPPATAILAAAGTGERLGAAGPKALVEVAGRPMLSWSIEALSAAAGVVAAVIAVPPGHERAVQEAAAAAAGEMPVQVVTGGDSRSQSVRLALERVDAAIVAVHDAARPLVTPELVDELVEKLGSRPDAAGVIAAAPLTDTVKRAREPRPAKGSFARGGPTVAQTVSRDHLWAAQTPQVFRTDALRKALDAAPDRLAGASDDAMLVERAGGKVVIHPAPPENLKVTTPLDLRVAELLLAEREPPSAKG